MDALQLAKLAVQAAEEKKAKRPLIQDLRGVSDLCQYQVILSGENERQTQAICESIEEVLRREANTRPFAIEGKQTGHWILLDYGSILIHVFFDYVRDYYAIETLFSKSRAVEAP